MKTGYKIAILNFNFILTTTVGDPEHFPVVSGESNFLGMFDGNIFSSLLEWKQMYYYYKPSELVVIERSSSTGTAKFDLS